MNLNFTDWIDQPSHDIAVILPTRGRKELLKTSLMSLINRARNPEKLQIIIGHDNDDRDSIDYAQKEIFNELSERGIWTRLLEFEPMGYVRLNEYVNALAGQSNARWIMFWNDDAVMQTQDWDTEISRHNGKFHVLRVKTHNEHPYSIFPIVPREWYYLFGYLSLHQLNDAWISQIAYMLNIMYNIDVEVLHDRHDITGNNKDETFNKRIMFEGNPGDPRDFNHQSYTIKRYLDAKKIAWYLQSRGEDITWFRDVASGKQDPWERMLNEFDPNGQVKKLD